jgi:hypothetical protein
MGQPITISSNSGKHIEPMTVPRKGLELPPHSSIRPIVLFRPPFTPLGVGSDNPDAVALVGESDAGSFEHTPARIEPQRGQVPENDAESAASESCAVFHEHVAGSNFTHDSRHFSPEAGSLAFDAGAFPGRADVLAREASRNHVNNSRPRSSVKAAHVRPNRERFDASIVLPLRQKLCAVGITLNCADASPAEQVASENSSTSAREKSQLIQSRSPAYGASSLGPPSLPLGAVDVEGRPQGRSASERA